LPELRKNNESKSYNAILVIVDKFSNMTQNIPLCDTIDAAKLANVLVHKLKLRGTGVLFIIVNGHGT
jgi:small nuclear ribonucleoprotein (snRNP)-like protein